MVQVHGQEFKAQRNRHVLSPELERIIASAPEQHRKAVTSLSQVVKASPTTAYGMTDLLKLVEELTNLNQQARSIISDTQEAVDALNVVRFWLEDANELDKLKKQVAVLEDRLVLQTKLADKARSDALQVRQTHSDPTGR